MGMTAVVVARAGELADDEGRVVEHGGREYALWRLADGTVRVLDNHCLHLSGPLADGLIEDGCVICPWHGWTYELSTGRRRSAFGPLGGVGCYRAWIEGDEVWADLP
jgi:nitrite reductase (NADH) small subunit